MNKDFVIYNRILEFRKYTRCYLLVNIPKVHSDIRIHFTDESYKMVELFVNVNIKCHKNFIVKMS